VLLAVAQNVEHQVKYARLVEDFSGPTIKAAFDLLCTARVIKRVASAKPTGLPLGATASSKRFKAILVNVGLWQHLCGMKTSAEFAKENLLNIYRGAMAEQFIGQELTAAQDSELPLESGGRARSLGKAGAWCPCRSISNGHQAVGQSQVPKGDIGKFRRQRREKGGIHGRVGSYPPDKREILQKM
jgi:hypothetical protein